MKKILFAFLLAFYCLSVNAQSNWKKYYSNFIEGITTYNEFSWIFYHRDIIRINQITKEEKIIEVPKDCYYFYSYIALNDEIWLSSYRTGKLFHYKNEQWTTHTLDSEKEYKFSYLNRYTNKILISVSTKKDFIVIDGDSLHSISIKPPILYENWDNAVLTNSNTIIYNTQFNLGIAEIDINGQIKNYYNSTNVLSQCLYMQIIGVDQNNTLILNTNMGLYKAIFNINDTLFNNIIPSNKLDSLKPIRFFINNDNQLMVGSNPYLNDTFVSCFNMNGKKISQYYLYSEEDKLNNEFIGFNHKNQPLVIYKNSSIAYNENDSLKIYFKNKSEYKGDEIKYTCFSNNETFFSGKGHHYTLKQDSLTITKFDTTLPLPQVSYRAMTIDNHNNLYLVIRSQNKLYLYKKGGSAYAKYIDIIPTKNNDINDLDGSGLYLDRNNLINVVMKNHVLTYDPNQIQKKWDTISRKIASNLVVAQSLNSFCKDSKGDIWFATDKGIAKIVNNYIVIQPDINITGNITDIKYDQKTNTIVTYKDFYHTHDFYIYNLNTNQLTTETTFMGYSGISIDSNSNVYITTDYRVRRYNLEKQEWDTLFNKENEHTTFNGNWTNIECDKKGNVYLISTGTSYNVIYIYNNKGFLSVNTSIKNKINLNIFPNPVIDILNINSKEAFQEYIIYDVFGVELQKGVIKNNTLNLSSLPSGLYTIKLSSSKGEVFKKVVKN